MGKQASTVAVTAIEQARADLKALQAEQAGIPVALARAAADSHALVALRHHADELPEHIQAAHAHLEQLNITEMERRLPGLQAERNQTAEAANTLWQAANAAQLAAEEASAAAGDVHAALQSLTIDIAERKRLLATLVERPSREQRAVRSTWQVRTSGV